VSQSAEVISQLILTDWPFLGVQGAQGSSQKGIGCFGVIKNERWLEKIIVANAIGHLHALISAVKIVYTTKGHICPYNRFYL